MLAMRRDSCRRECVSVAQLDDELELGEAEKAARGRTLKMASCEATLPDVRVLAFIAREMTDSTWARSGASRYRMR